jgi:hypothetical protein
MAHRFETLGQQAHFSSPCQGKDEGEGGTSIHQYLTQKTHTMSRTELVARPALDVAVRLNGQSSLTILSKPNRDGQKPQETGQMTQYS